MKLTLKEIIWLESTLEVFGVSIEADELRKKLTSARSRHEGFPTTFPRFLYSGFQMSVKVPLNQGEINTLMGEVAFYLTQPHPPQEHQTALRILQKLKRG